MRRTTRIPSISVPKVYTQRNQNFHLSKFSSHDHKLNKNNRCKKRSRSPRDRRHFSANFKFIIIHSFFIRMPSKIASLHHRISCRDEWENCFSNLWVIIVPSHAINMFFPIHNLPQWIREKLKNPFDWERRECCLGKARGKVNDLLFGGNCQALDICNR